MNGRVLLTMMYRFATDAGTLLIRMNGMWNGDNAGLGILNACRKLGNQRNHAVGLGRLAGRGPLIIKSKQPSVKLVIQALCRTSW